MAKVDISSSNGEGRGMEAKPKKTRPFHAATATPTVIGSVMDNPSQWEERVFLVARVVDNRMTSAGWA